VDLLRRVLSARGSKIEATNDPRDGARCTCEFRPDLILLDLHMPHKSGLEVLDELNADRRGQLPAVLMLTGDLTQEARQEALSRGAKDFLNKPFSTEEVLLRIGTLLETRFLYLQIQSQNQMLEAKVRERTRALEAAQIEIIERLAKAAEFRDDNTGQHTERVGQMAALLARRSAARPQVALIRRAAPLHDVGKIGIPDTILLKQGKLTRGVRTRQDPHGDRRAHPLGQPVSRSCSSPRKSPSATTSGGTATATPASAGDAIPLPGASWPWRRVRRADAAAPLQGGVADRRGAGRDRPPARPAVRSAARGRVPAWSSNRAPRCRQRRRDSDSCARGFPIPITGLYSPLMSSRAEALAAWIASG
jgi:putative two-component system response regulator